MEEEKVEITFLKIEGDETYMLIRNEKINNDMVKVFRLPKGLKYGTKYILTEVSKNEQN